MIFSASAFSACAMRMRIDALMSLNDVLTRISGIMSVTSVCTIL